MDGRSPRVKSNIRAKQQENKHIDIVETKTIRSISRYIFHLPTICFNAENSGGEEILDCKFVPAPKVFTNTLS